MNLNGSIPNSSGSRTQPVDELAALLEKCHNDLKFTNQLLDELENPESTELSICNEPGLQNSASLGGEAVRRLTHNIEALSLEAGQPDVQAVMQAMYTNMVRCLKLLPAQHR